MEKENNNAEILGYYVEDNTIVLEMKLKNIEGVEDKIVGVGFNKQFVDWMLKEFDRWDKREQE